MDGYEAEKRLTAFADGELGPAEQVPVLEYLAAHPQAMGRVIHQQRLRQAVDRAMHDRAGRVPLPLRRKVEQMMMTAVPEVEATGGSTPPVTAADRGHSPIAYLGRWAPAAVAAVLLIFTLAAVTTTWGPGTSGDAALIPAGQLAMFTKRHVDCALQLAPLSDAVKFPERLSEIPAAIAQHTGAQSYPVLGLSAMGYEFEAIGPCSVPGMPSVHMIYRARPETGRRDAMSLWMIKDRGQIDIPPDIPYTVTSIGAPHPVIIWRHSGMLYYLVGDSTPRLQEAIATLALNL